jgi:hypothetical protein
MAGAFAAVGDPYNQSVYEGSLDDHDFNTDTHNLLSLLSAGIARVPDPMKKGINLSLFIGWMMA